MVAAVRPCSNFCENWNSRRSRDVSWQAVFRLIQYFRDLRRDTRIPGLFVVATVCTRDNTHASTQKIQALGRRYVIPVSTWVLDVLRLSVVSRKRDVSFIGQAVNSSRQLFDTAIDISSVCDGEFHEISV